MEKSDIVGREFGLLTIESALGVDKSRNWIVRCKCQCGGSIETRFGRLRRGETRSCGCLRKSLAKQRTAHFFKHGLSAHRLYKTWNSMVQRCHDPKSQAFHHYGARGIQVCERWMDVRNFVADMDDSYAHGLSLDRIDNDGPYSPENCRWSTTLQQNNNRRSTVYVEWRGERHSISEWSRIVGVPYDCLAVRLRKLGWTTEKAMTTPSQRG